MVYSEECGACNNVLRMISELKIRKYFNLVKYQSLKPTDEVLNSGPFLSVPYFFTIKDEKKKLLSNRLIFDVLNKYIKRARLYPVEKKTVINKLFEDIRNSLRFD